MSPNFEKGRKGHKVAGFVIHMTEGSFASGVVWCENIFSRVSYHYIVAPSGVELKLVETDDTAWHAGLIKDPQTDFIKNGSNPNYYSIGIALAGFAEVGPTMQQMVGCAKLLKELAQKYNLTLDKKTIIPHHDIRTDKICPGLKVSIDTLVYLGSLPQ
jgi:N-acetyl-anhydromuramyl-L-alanine amidase AmpD